VFAVVAVLFPTVVGVASCHLGLHHLTDVAGGAALGVLSLLIVQNALVRARGGRPLSDPAP